jgi:hypothetical protein
VISLNPEHYKVRIRRSKRLQYRMLRALLQPARPSRHAVSRPRPERAAIRASSGSLRSGDQRSVRSP